MINGMYSRTSFLFLYFSSTLVQRWLDARSKGRSAELSFLNKNFLKKSTLEDIEVGNVYYFLKFSDQIFTKLRLVNGNT